MLIKYYVSFGLLLRDVCFLVWASGVCYKARDQIDEIVIQTKPLFPLKYL